jgi:hypothetical protein
VNSIQLFLQNFTGSNLWYHKGLNIYLRCYSVEPVALKAIKGVARL